LRWKASWRFSLPDSRIVVPESWVESNGHMKMRRYVALFGDAGDAMSASVIACTRPARLIWTIVRIS
jgi:hypothetical protein